MIYIVIYNQSLRIIGPFHNIRDACLFGDRWQKDNRNNPCWHMVNIEGDAIAQLVIDVEQPATAPLVIS